MSRLLLLVSIVASLAAAPPLPIVLDLETGAAAEVDLPGAKTIPVKLLAVKETRDPVCGAVRASQAEVSIAGKRTVLNCGNYNLPVTIGPVQADCAVTRGYYANTNRDFWGLAKDARLRFWPAGQPFLPPGIMVYPARQKWFATHTQMANEPTYVDDGENARRKQIYYHSALDIGGAEGLVEVIAATAGQVVASGLQVLDGYTRENAPLDPRYDRVYVLDERGWFHRYVHLFSIDPAVKPGARLQMGQKIGLLGKEGTSGGWAHLHYEIFSRQPSGKWGTLEGYALLWEAYLRDYQPDVIAVARPHQVARTGDRVTLDGSRSWCREGRIRSYEWSYTDGGKASGKSVTRTYPQPGTYSEMLKVTDSRGRTAWDFATVNIVDAGNPAQSAPTIHAAYSPTFGIQPGQPVTFQVRTFGAAEGDEVWDFGDGSPKAATRSDGNRVPMAKDGYAVITHTYDRPGDYIVRVECADREGHKGVARLHVRVDARR